MSGVTEIYICKAGQKLKEGRLLHSDDVTDKYQAEADAKGRCARDNTIAKVAYYSVSESGNFRNFYTYENLECADGGPGKMNGQSGTLNGVTARVEDTEAPGHEGARGAGRKSGASLLSRVAHFFTEEVKT